MTKKTKKTKPQTAASFIRKHGVEAYTWEKIRKDEERRVNESGAGTNRQANALCREYVDRLEKLITDDMINPRRSIDIWAALRGSTGWPIKEITERLLRHGLNAAGASSIGADRKGVKHPRDVALWLGDRLSQLQQRDTVLEAHLGAWGITLLLHLSDIFALDENNVLILSQSGFLKRFYNDVIDRAAYADPYVLPFTKSAAPWTGVRQGPLGKRIPLVSRAYSEAPIQEAIEDGEMSRVLGALNALQSVWFVINKPVLAIAKDLAPGIPPTPKKGSPDFAKQKERRRRAHQKALNYHSDMEFAEMVAEEGQFCVPHNLDFRGRVNAIPHFNYQRADHIRGLFLFAEGERLGDDGLQWLQYQVANCADGVTWGGADKPSKLSFEDHIAWTERNRRQLCNIADDVLRGVVPDLQLLPKDKIQFLAACVELKQALDTDPVSSFETRLPISLDGCCSGLQHFCGLMKAPEGRLAGLTPRGPNEVAEDFYTEIAKIVGPTNPEIMNRPDDRVIAKPPTQIYFFGAGAKKMAKEIEEVIDDLGREAEPEQIMKLAKEIKKACCKLMPAAKKVRTCVSRLASLYAQNGLVLCWSTKSGFRVVHEYHKPDIRDDVAVRLRWKRVDCNLTVGDLDELRVKKSGQSAAANFVHSLDAAHLHEIVWMAKVYGIRMAVVHDCFASLAPRMAKLNDIIQERFIALHGQSFLMLKDMLAAAKRDLPANTKLPKRPINQGPFIDLMNVRNRSLTGWA